MPVERRSATESATPRNAARMLARIARWLTVTAIAVHFSLILLQATALHDWLGAERSLAPLFEVARIYRALSFANRSYRFFAPDVADDLKLEIALSDATGSSHSYALQGDERELVMRRRALLDHMVDSPEHLHDYTHAIACYALREDGAASAATVRVMRISLPSMSGFRNGERARAQLLVLRTLIRSECVPRSEVSP